MGLQELIFYDAIKDHRELAEDIAHYNRLGEESQHVDRSFDYLLNCVNRSIRVKRHEINKAALSRGFSGRPAVPAPKQKGKEKGKGKGKGPNGTSLLTCRYFQEGNCQYGDQCKYSHAVKVKAAPAPKVKAKAKPKGGKGKGKGKDNGATKSQGCRFIFGKNGCRLTAETCLFSHAEKHRPAAPAVAVPEAKPKAKPNAKGKAKAAAPARILTAAMMQRHENGQDSDDDPAPALSDSSESDMSMPGLMPQEPGVERWGRSSSESGSDVPNPTVDYVDNSATARIVNRLPTSNGQYERWLNRWRREHPGIRYVRWPRTESEVWRESLEDQVSEDFTLDSLDSPDDLDYSLSDRPWMDYAEDQVDGLRNRLAVLL